MGNIETVVLANGTDEKEFPVVDTIARQRLDTVEKNYKILKTQVSEDEKELQNIGIIRNLKTSSKETLVDAINELQEKIAALSSSSSTSGSTSYST